MTFICSLCEGHHSPTATRGVEVPSRLLPVALEDRRATGAAQTEGGGVLPHEAAVAQHVVSAGREVLRLSGSQEPNR